MSEAAAPARLIDTHLHLIYPERLSYPWLAGVPAIDHPHRLDTYAPRAAALGIEAALHMEVDVAAPDRAAETAFVLGLGAPVIGAVAACRPEDEGFPAELDALLAEPRVRGLRRILHVVPDGLSQTPLFAQNLRRAGRAGLSFDLCLRADQLHLGVALAQACPEVQFVLDHCGVPDIAGGAFAPWAAGIDAIAALPNLAVKLSGIAAYAAPGWTVETLRPWVAHVIDRFTPARMVWGSDAPVLELTTTLEGWVAATHALLAELTPGERAAILAGNARRLYRLDAA